MDYFKKVYCLFFEARRKTSISGYEKLSVGSVLAGYLKGICVFCIYSAPNPQPYCGPTLWLKVVLLSLGNDQK